jgi:hypothetical protein
MHTEESDRVTVDDVVAAVDDVDVGTARDALEPVTDDGTVTRAAAETTVSDVSKLLATAETRIELAGDAYDDVAGAADPVADVPTVRARLDGVGERLSAVESRIPELRPDLSIPEAVETRPVAAYEFAVGIREVVVTAQEAIEAADDLSFDAEQFESWLRRPERRYDEFAEDVEAVADAADDLADAVDALADGPAEPAAGWADATMRARVLSLLLADLRAELADLRTLADRDGAPVRAGLADRLDRTEERVIGVESALDSRADPAWRDRFGDDVAAFEAALSTFEPPIEWGVVDRTLSEHRPDDLGESADGT